jgi:hypothetical protein
MRKLRGLFLLLAILVLLMAAVPPVGAQLPEPSPDHADDHSHDGEAHAAEDLANIPISVIERKTSENAERIFRETGRRPGAARPAKKGESSTAASDITAVAVSADPGISGKWSSVIGTQVVPIFQAMLPNGKVLMWDSVGDNAAENYPNHTFTRAQVWSPTANTFKRVDVAGYNIFCAGFAHLPNGNILVAGGNANSALAGIVQTHIFNWQTETWSRGPNMASGRWYPSVAQVANGEQIIIGGGPSRAEVYQANNTLRALTGFTSYSARLYPFLISRPDVQIGLIGPTTGMQTIFTPGVGTITATGTRDTIYRDYGSFATYDIGRSLVVGGGVVNEGGLTNVPTKSSVVVNSNTPVPTVAPSGAMSQGRRQHNATVLADGSVLVTGGLTKGGGTVDLNNAITSAELWNPATGAWTLLASAARIRQYHSTATLLPDGRVMTGGGGVSEISQQVGYLEKNVEYFSPPYLYKKDGSGALAARPTISTAPASVGINSAFSITSSQAAGIRKVGLVGLSDVTHGMDQSQRYIPLKFTVSGTTLNVTSPPTSGVAPPGHYMLFITDAAGVPSVAKFIQVIGGPKPLLSPARNQAVAHCIDVPGSSLARNTYLQAHACNGSRAQAITRFTNDNSIRVLGLCLDVPYGNFVSGQRIQTYTCASTNANQRLIFRTDDDTIRPVSASNMCVAAASTAADARIQLAACNGSSLQKWSRP